MTALLEIPVAGPYDFMACLYGHGWMWLEPFTPHEQGFRRVLRLPDGQVVSLDVTADDVAEGMILRVAIDDQLSEANRDFVRHQIRWMLRLDEDLDPFYERARSVGNGYERAPGRGRLLRSPTLFEDACKVILTTNTTWRQTKEMVARLVAGLGAPHPGHDSRCAFPVPEAVAAAGEPFFRDDVRAGYRSQALVELGERAAELAELQESDLPTAELRKRLLTFRGVGPYAAAALLMLLGRYDYLAIDSELRAFTARHYFDGQKPADGEIRDIYDSWGRWRYLAYALDPHWDHNQEENS